MNAIITREYICILAILSRDKIDDFSFKRRVRKHLGYLASFPWLTA